MHAGGGGPGGGGGGTDYDKVFSPKEVTRRATIIDKPEPLYTEEARKNQITGAVRVRMVLNANGSVTGIAAVSRLPDGLTEKAIEAARRIKFTPAEKDGRKVSQYITIDYNFNIY
jgi:TonB family protein